MKSTGTAADGIHSPGKFTWLLLFLGLSVTAGVQPRFKHLTIRDGLSQSSVNCMVEDRHGMLWLGTQDGLNRFDGYQFKVFHESEEPGSLTNSWIHSMVTGRDGELWLGTGRGVNRYDPRTGTFSELKHPAGKTFGLVPALYFEAPHTLWIAALNQGVERVNLAENTATSFRHDPKDPQSLGHDRPLGFHMDASGMMWVGLPNMLDRINTFSGEVHHFALPNQPNPSVVTTLTEDDSGFIWIGTFDNGLFRLNPVNSVMTHYRHDPADPTSLPHNNITHILEDHEKMLWVGTWGGGMARLERIKNQFERIRHDPRDPDSLGDDRVYVIHEDPSGIIWAGTSTAGLSYWDRNQGRFTLIDHNPYDDNSPAENLIHTLFEDQSGMIWMGMDNHGVDRMDPKTGIFTHFRHNPNDPNTLSSDRISMIRADSMGHLWVGTFSNGLNRMDAETDTFTRYVPQRQRPDGLKHPSISDLRSDHLGNLWIATLGGGLHRYVPESDGFERFLSDPNNPKTLTSNNIMVLFHGLRGDLWVGTDNGFNRFDVFDKSVTRYETQPNQPGLSNPEIFALNEDHRGVLWVGTARGLNRFDPSSQAYTSYTTKDGLPNNIINGILNDSLGRIWLSTNRGLSMMDPKRNTFRNYDAHDGLQSNEFALGSAHATRDGRLMFGGIKGFNIFDPLMLGDNTYVPPVVINDFQISEAGDSIRKTRTPNGHTIESTKTLVLNQNHRFVSLGFAALHYANPHKNQYAYMLEPFESDWVTTPSDKRFATYTNLEPGSYLFKVKGANEDGVWNHQGVSLEIVVKPSHLWTWWAKLLYVVGLVLLVIVLIRLQGNKRSYQTKLAANEGETAGRLLRVDKLKNEFLVTISHELRTPLNGIIGLAESMLDGARGSLTTEQANDMGMIVAGGKRLSSLVNDILDLSRLKSSDLELKLKAVDLRGAVEVVLTHSKPLVEGKPVELINQIPGDLPPAEADEERLLQILHNLIGNAVKFTHKGAISVAARRDQDMLMISVLDTGMGVPEDQQTEIFHTFNQIEGDVGRIYGGTGLGLAITRRLVKLHGGDISVSSIPGSGSMFSFSLPISSKRVETNIIEEPHEFHSLSLSGESLPTPNLEPGEIEMTADEAGRFHILIVDDETVNRRVLVNHLTLRHFKVTEATDGEECLRLVEERDDFDLILLDVMMPVMSGYTVCEKLRETRSLQELPIILLTARDYITDLVTAFKAGGNDFLTKPITKEELFFRVRTHLQLLDINRNLERKVAKRTVELKKKNRALDAQNNELEILDGIVKEINRSINPREVFQTLLEQARLLFPEVERGLLFLCDTDETNFHPAAAIGFENGPPKNAEIQYDEMIARYITRGDDWGDGIYLVQGGETPDLHFGRRPEAVLVMVFKQSNHIKGLVVWEAAKGRDFDHADLRKLRRFRYHAGSAVAKAQFMDTLREKNKAIVQAQDHLIVQEKMATLGTLTAGVAHELNNPNNFISLNAQNLKTAVEKFQAMLMELVEDEADEGLLRLFRERFDQLLKHTDTILSGSRRIHEVVHNLRGLSRLDEAEQKPVDILEGLRAAIQFLKPQYLDISFELDLEQSVTLICRPAEVNQIYLNLIQNACQAVMIQLEKAGTDAPAILHISSDTRDGGVTLTFKDTGCGIPAELHQKIFEPFFSTKGVGEGSGLGLYTVYRLVEKHQGRIQVESTPGQGASFRVFLPGVVPATQSPVTAADAEA